MAKRGNNEGSIYKRSNGVWVAAIHQGYDANGRRLRQFVTGKTRHAVASKLIDLQKAEKDGLPTPGERLTVGKFLSRWLSDVAATKLRPRTFSSYTMIVEKHLKPALGRAPLVRLTPEQVQRYMNEKRSAGLSARTVQYHHAVLRAALGQAEIWGHVSRNVAKLVRAGGVERPEIRPLTPEQARRLLTSIQGDRLAALFSLAFTLGLRQGELLGLTWDDVDLDFCTLSVRHTLQRYDGAFHLDPPKTDRSRRDLPLTPGLVQQLRGHKDRQLEECRLAGPHWKGSEWNLIFSDDVGQPISGFALRRRFHRLLSEADLPRQRFHDARHASASYLLAQGADLSVVMKVLGHSTINVTANTYAHILMDQQRAALERVDVLLTR